MKNLVTLAPLLLLLGGLFFLRPPLLGGDTTYVMVSGKSMEPTMYTGDLALARRQASYGFGDVVAFRADEGGMVIHRIIGGNAEVGFVLQGDNNDWTDQWRPTQDQIAGKAVLVIPRLGTVFSYLRDPLRMAVAVGVFSMYLSLAGSLLTRSAGGRRRRDRRRTMSGRWGRNLNAWLPW